MHINLFIPTQIFMGYDAADYERREEVAIRDGKTALAKAPWLFNRSRSETKGFFAEVKSHPALKDHFVAHCVDGIGTKLFLSAWSGNYRTMGRDGLAMNANDMATLIRAFPSEVNLYFAVQGGVEQEHMGEIMSGFVDALTAIRIPNAPWDVNIGKIETASLDEMISLGVAGKGWDVGVSLVGYIEKSLVPFLRPQPGHVIVGVSSTGMHSNGYTAARHVLLTPDIEPREEWKAQYQGRFSLHDKPELLQGRTILKAMLEATALYTVEAALIGRQFSNCDIYGINITGNGLHNFNRAGKGVSFEITDPLDPLPIHKLLVQESHWDPQTAYKKQNMGMGFAYVVPSLEIAEGMVRLINKRSENKAQIVGEVAKAREGETVLRTTLHKPYEGPALEFVGYNS